MKKNIRAKGAREDFQEISFGTVPDGFNCDYSNPLNEHEKIVGICITGKCEPIGCDKIAKPGKDFSAIKRIDNCKICGGDDSTCDKHQFNPKNKYLYSGSIYEPIHTVPKFSTNVVIRDFSSKTLLSVFQTHKNSGVFRLNGNRLRPDVPGIYPLGKKENLVYNRNNTADGQEIEEVVIDGPISSDLQVFAFLPQLNGIKRKSENGERRKIETIKWEGSIDFYSREGF